MQTQISKAFSQSPHIEEAEKILRSCVHCGFCTATCPTYQLLHNELDSPRGRIYLIKQVLEGNSATKKTQQHLDRCLSCRSCETTCPSGVKYTRLLDICKEVIEQHVHRPLPERLKRYALRRILPYPRRFSLLLKIGHSLKPVLPDSIKHKIPNAPKRQLLPSSAKKSMRRMLLLQGCAQSVVTPSTNQAATELLGKLGIELINAPQAGCCGAVSYHLTANKEAKDFIRNNIDAWWPYVEAQTNTNNCEAIVITASGCGVMLKDYGKILKNDPVYAKKAKRISELAKDISEIIHNERINNIVIKKSTQKTKIAFHSPCTLQHGQKLNGVVEKILDDAGYELLYVENSHLCCGSAGTYSLLQPALSQTLLNNKLASLESKQPDIIATANIGCQMHLDSRANVPVKHWIELVNARL